MILKEAPFNVRGGWPWFGCHKPRPNRSSAKVRQFPAFLLLNIKYELEPFIVSLVPLTERMCMLICTPCRPKRWWDTKWDSICRVLQIPSECAATISATLEIPKRNQYPRLGLEAIPKPNPKLLTRVGCAMHFLQVEISKILNKTQAKSYIFKKNQPCRAEFACRIYSHFARSQSQTIYFKQELAVPCRFYIPNVEWFWKKPKPNYKL